MQELCESHEKRLDKIETSSEKQHSDIWDEVRNRVPVRLFYILILLVVSDLAFNGVLLTSMGELKTQIAVLETKMETHTKETTTTATTIPAIGYDNGDNKFSYKYRSR